MLTVSSPWMRNATLVTHTPNAIAITTLFLFQMAMLENYMSACRLKDWERVEEDVYAKHD